MLCTEINGALYTCSHIEADGMKGEGKARSASGCGCNTDGMPRWIKHPGGGPEPPLNTNSVFNGVPGT